METLIIPNRNLDQSAILQKHYATFQGVIPQVFQINYFYFASSAVTKSSDRSTAYLFYSLNYNFPCCNQLPVLLEILSSTLTPASPAFHRSIQSLTSSHSSCLPSLKSLLVPEGATSIFLNTGRQFNRDGLHHIPKYIVYWYEGHKEQSVRIFRVCTAKVSIIKRSNVNNAFF